MPRGDSEVQDALRESFLSQLDQRVIEALLQDAVRMEVPAGSLLYPEEGEPRAGLVVAASESLRDLCRGTPAML